MLKSMNAWKKYAFAGSGGSDLYQLCMHLDLSLDRTWIRNLQNVIGWIYMHRNVKLPISPRDMRSYLPFVKYLFSQNWNWKRVRSLPGLVGNSMTHWLLFSTLDLCDSSGWRCLHKSCWCCCWYRGKLIPGICQFWYTTTLFWPVRSTQTKK